MPKGNKGLINHISNNITESEIINLTQIIDFTDNHEFSNNEPSTQLISVGDDYKKALNVIFTQMSANEVIKMFSEKAVVAIFREFKQLNGGVLPGNPVIVLIDIGLLTVKDKKKALEAVNIIKAKQCGEIKGKIYANGSF